MFFHDTKTFVSVSTWALFLFHSMYDVCSIPILLVCSLILFIPICISTHARLSVSKIINEMYLEKVYTVGTKSTFYQRSSL
jgi:hypothetical protein